jgi:hypothetical protein
MEQPPPQGAQPARENKNAHAKSWSHSAQVPAGLPTKSHLPIARETESDVPIKNWYAPLALLREFSAW